MWLFTTHGFFSIVNKSAGRETEIHVRARCRKHLENLLAAAGAPAGWEVLKSFPGSDYPWRMILTKREDLGLILQVVSQSLTYSNFKAELHRDQSFIGRVYSRFAGETWNGGWLFQRDTEFREQEPCPKPAAKRGRKRKPKG